MEENQSNMASILDEIAHYLPAQAPLEYFVHHNTLHAFEALPFYDAVAKASRVYGARSSLTDSDYREMVSIYPHFEQTLEKVVSIFLQERPAYAAWFERYQINPQHFFDCNRSLKNSVASGKLLTDFELLAQENLLLYYADLRWIRKKIEIQGDVRCEWKFLDYFIEFFNSFFHQTKTGKSEGSFVDDLKKYLEQKGFKFKDHEKQLSDWDHLIEQQLVAFGVPRELWHQWLLSLALLLPGWSGMIYQFSGNSQYHHLIHQQSVSWKGYLSLLLDLIIQHFPFASFKAWSEDLQRPESIQWDVLLLQQKWLEVMGEKKVVLGVSDLRLFYQLIEVDRGRVIQETLEACYRLNLLSLFSKPLEKQMPIKNSAEKRVPSYSAIFCIDEREESLRRHLEKVNPLCLTAGVAGFFAIDMNLKLSEKDPGYAHCPVFVKPKHEVSFLAQSSHSWQSILIKWSGLKNRQCFSFDDYWQLFFLFPLGIVLEALRLITPRYLKKIDPVVAKGKHQLPESTLGFPVRAQKVAQILKMAGMVDHFPSTIFIVGHGSTNFNNPLFSAYECGACAGRHGDHNAMVFCDLANHQQVRELLAENEKIMIPETTRFVPLMHDTCQSMVIPLSMETRKDILEAMKDFAQAQALEAKERVRRFPVVKGLAAVSHCQHRAHTLDEARPEYGHATNASVIVGPRNKSQHLFLDRRSFLVDYHEALDQNGDLLKAIISAIFPVCSGINLEYFFGRLDPQKYGSGSKLPHNVTGNIGIMNGKMSDLRPGLAEQMTEIHDPIRLTFIFMCSKKRLLEILESLPWTKPLIQNQWFYVYCLDSSHQLISINDPWINTGDLESVAIKNINDSLSYAGLATFYNAYLAVMEN